MDKLSPRAMRNLRGIELFVATVFFVSVFMAVDRLIPGVRLYREPFLAFIVFAIEVSLYDKLRKLYMPFLVGFSMLLDSLPEDLSDENGYYKEEVNESEESEYSHVTFRD